MPRSQASCSTSSNQRLGRAINTLVQFEYSGFNWMKPVHNLVVIIDASPSGVSGDKYLGALLGLGAKAETLRKVAGIVAQNLPGTHNVDVKVRKVERGEIGAQLVTIESGEKVEKRKGIQVLRSAEKCVETLRLSD